MKLLNDPIGQCIEDVRIHGSADDILVESDLCEDDLIPSKYLFRSYEEMPEVEQEALFLCKGSVLDVGAGSGIHSRHLINQGLEVHAIEISPNAVEWMKKDGISAESVSFFEHKGSYDTLLFLMNGAGIAGTLSRLPYFLTHAKSLISDQGQIIMDSSDVQFLYQEDDGSYWMDLNSEYHGNFRFRMHYKEHRTDWFDWLYVDFDTLSKVAEEAGLKTEKIVETKDYHYLARLTAAP